MRKIAERLFNRWVVHTAFDALSRFVDWASLTEQEQRDCVSALDVLRKKM